MGLCHRSAYSDSFLIPSWDRWHFGLIFIFQFGYIKVISGIRTALGVFVGLLVCLLQLYGFWKTCSFTCLLTPVLPRALPSPHDQRCTLKMLSPSFCLTFSFSSLYLLRSGCFKLSGVFHLPSFFHGYDFGGAYPFKGILTYLKFEKLPSCDFGENL